MRALTLTQPWASLVAAGAKSIETRSWSTSYRGPVAIHAAKGWTDSDRSLCVGEPFYGELRRALGPDANVVYDLPRGSIVAVVLLVDVVRTTDPALVVGAREAAFGNYAPGRFAWRLAAVRRLAEPVPCRGALGLWTVPADVAEGLVI